MSSSCARPSKRIVIDAFRHTRDLLVGKYSNRSSFMMCSLKREVGEGEAQGEDEQDGGGGHLPRPINASSSAP